jgi:uncharacterized protein (TIGR00369 family)
MDRSVDELSGHCFGCGPENPEGLHLEFAIDAEAHAASASVTLDDRYQGAPGYMHGGIIATLLDEAMSKLNRPLGLLAMTRQMDVSYLRPAAIGTAMQVRSRFVRRDGRKLFHEAELLSTQGEILARCTGLWIVIDPALLGLEAPTVVEPA